MTTKLSDLRKACDCHYGKIPTKGEHPFTPKWVVHKRCGGSGILPAEVSDLVEALQAEGVGEVVEATDADQAYDEWALVPVRWPGRYLVVPLGEDA